MIDRKSVRNRYRKGLRIIKEHNRQFSGDYEDVHDRKAIGRYGTTPKSCSCWMCGNIRNAAKGNARLTLKERVFNSPKIYDEYDD